MATATAAENVAKQYIQNRLSPNVTNISLIGMDMTSEGRCIGFKVEVETGSLGSAVLGGIFFGLMALLFSAAIGLLLVWFIPPTLLVIAGSLFSLIGLYLGVESGYNSTTVERMTVTVDQSGNVVTANRNLTDGEFYRAIDRQYDRQTSQFDSAVGQVSKHWFYHKIVDNYLFDKDGND